MSSLCMPTLVRPLVVVPELEPDAELPFAIGETIAAHYEIRGVLGRGGMGVIYDARDRLVERAVAIKAPLSACFAPAIRREAFALASLRGSAFPTLFHVARERDLELLVMERIYGDTLEARIDETYGAGRRLEIAGIVDVLTRVAAALASAHAVAVSQRDLKPSNVILTPDRVVLVDFGLFVPEVLVGPDNEVNGSVDYIAPEVLRRAVARGEGPLVDLYGLGVLAFEMLTGTTPFRDRQLSRTLRKHLDTVAPDVRTSRPDTPSALALLVGELLAKRPKDRPVSAEAVVWQLESVRRSV